MTDVLSWIRLPGPFLIGHRGFPGAARENTPSSFEAALEHGCDGIELDVRFTRDLVPVVHHDERAATTDGEIAIAALDGGVLEPLTFLAPEGPYRISTLREVLGSLSGRCLINVEVKPVLAERREAAAERTLAEIRRIRPRESVLVSSFDADFLESLHRLDRSVALAYLFDRLPAFNHLEQGTAIDCMTAIHPRHDLIDAKLIKRAGERNLMVMAWTVDDPAEAERLVAMGVAGIVTNRPDREFVLFPAGDPGA